MIVTRIFHQRVTKSSAGLVLARIDIARRQEKGMALLLMLVLITFAVTAGTLWLPSNPSALKLASIQKNAIALKRAKQALLAYAATPHSHAGSQSIRPGELPCPDIDGDGKIRIDIEYRGTHCRALIGWLPWHSLGLEDVRDATGARLWYAVSGPFYNYSGNASNEPILNSLTPANLLLNGQSAAALIMAPNSALPGQYRNNDNTVDAITAFLEVTHTSRHQMVSLTTTRHSNDTIVRISTDELFRPIEKQALAVISERLNAFYNAQGSYPYAAADHSDHCDLDNKRETGTVPGHCIEGAVQLNYPDSLTHWIQRNQWHRVFSYRLVVPRNYIQLRAKTGHATRQLQQGKTVQISVKPRTDIPLTAEMIAWVW